MRENLGSFNEKGCHFLDIWQEDNALQVLRETQWAVLLGAVAQLL